MATAWHPKVMPTYRVRDTTDDSIVATAEHEDVSTAEAWAAVTVERMDQAPVAWVLERE